MRGKTYICGIMQSNHERRMREEINKLKRELEVCSDATGATPEGDTARSAHHTCCGKIGFDTKEEALASIRTKRKSKYPIRSYRCEEGRWHLTSMTRKTYKIVNSHDKGK